MYIIASAVYARLLMIYDGDSAFIAGSVLLVALGVNAKSHNICPNKLVLLGV